MVAELVLNGERTWFAFIFLICCLSIFRSNTQYLLLKIEIQLELDLRMVQLFFEISSCSTLELAKNSEVYRKIE